MSCPVPDRRGETWEETPRDEHGFTPFHHGSELERFIVVGAPVRLVSGEYNDVSSWWHPVLWIDDCGPSAEADPDENGINEEHFKSGRYVRLG